MPIACRLTGSLQGRWWLASHPGRRRLLGRGDRQTAQAEAGRGDHPPEKAVAHRLTCRIFQL
jgi:hypothetical protein